MIETPRNYEQKCPLVLVLDLSFSMVGEPLRELNDALNTLKQDILNDPLLSSRMELAIVGFHDNAELLRDFDLVLPDHKMPHLREKGTTNMEAGLRLAFDLVEDRKEYYKNGGQQYYRPIVVLFSDGAPNTENDIVRLDSDIQQLSDQKKVMFLPFGIGAGCDMQTLAKLGPIGQDGKGQAYRLKDIAGFSEVFKFLSASVSAALKSDDSQAAVELPDCIEVERH
jgi:uncharacterized protein YegL